MFSRLDHVQLAIPSGGEERGGAFYVEVLGFEEVEKPPHLAREAGPWFPQRATWCYTSESISTFSRRRKAHPALRCKDYDSALEHIAKRGGSVTPDPVPFEGRPHCFYIRDPFGNRIELIG